MVKCSESTSTILPLPSSPHCAPTMTAVFPLLIQSPVASGQWIVHLGMTGQMLVASPGSDLAKHTHLVAKLSSGRELRFVDPRRFGRLSVHKPENTFAAQGGEPLGVSAEEFIRLFKRRETP